jgi:hypothetical protein
MGALTLRPAGQILAAVPMLGVQAYLLLTSTLEDLTVAVLLSGFMVVMVGMILSRPQRVVEI